MLNKTFTLISLGCKVNSYESEAVKEELLELGYQYKEELPADYLIINTCAVTLVAEKKDMEKIRSVSRNYPDCKIIVMGCFSQLHPQKIEGIKNVIAVLGTSKRSEVTKIIASDQKREDLLEENTRTFPYEELHISSFLSPIRAFVKIQDGCDNFCSYCVIPRTRGESRSRDKKEIIEEVKRLSNNGYKEIVLIGIDTGSYKSKDGEGFSSLVEDILNIEPKNFRVRISSIEESQIDDKLISILKTNSRLVPHLHIPLQSGSEKILSLMRRKYDLSSFLSLKDKLNAEIPNIALSTDVIVGFPQETENDFESTLNFVKEVSFMRTHVFPYSRRPFTVANLMEGQIDPLVKKERARRLIKEGEELAKEYIIKTSPFPHVLLVEEELDSENGKRVFRGYTENYIDVKISSSDDLMGKFVEVNYDKDGIIKPGYKVLDSLI